jgi:predicted aldo/keto reductase-like oxidoreductase
MREWACEMMSRENRIKRGINYVDTAAGDSRETLA